MNALFGRIKKAFSTEEDAPPKESKGGASFNFDQYYFPEIVGQSEILNKEEIEFVDKCLPKRMVGVRWILKYSTDNDGFSLGSLYRSLNKWEHPVLLVIEDFNSFKFGSFGTESFRPDYKVRGTTECFVFRLKNPIYDKEMNRESNALPRQPSQDSVMRDYEIVNLPSYRKENVQSNGQNNSNGDIVEVNSEGAAASVNPEEFNDDSPQPNFGESTKDAWFEQFDFKVNKSWKWTAQHENCVFVHGENHYLRIGMHDGKTALWVDGDLHYGGSDHCEIFDNERLAPSRHQPSCDNKFRIRRLEVWGFKQ